MDFLKEITAKGLCSSGTVSAAKIKARQEKLEIIECILQIAKTDTKMMFDGRAIIKLYCECNNFAYVDNANDVKFNKLALSDSNYVKAFNGEFIPVLLDSKEIVLFRCGALSTPMMKSRCQSTFGRFMSIGFSPDSVLKELINTYVRPTALTKMSQTASESIGFHAISVDKAINLNESDGSDLKKVYNSTITEAVLERASDIHFIPSGSTSSEVYFKIDGMKIHVSTFRFGTQRLMPLISAEAEMSEKSLLSCRTGKIYAQLDQRTIELRINVIPSKQGPDINLRILPDSASSMESLGMSGYVLSRYKKALSNSKGMVLITGPMGCGKSTTLYSGIVMLRDLGKDVCEVGDPVEIKIPGVTQVDASDVVNFNDAQEAFLRHNANVQMIGEIRNEAVARTAFRAANTGTLVLSTLHTNSAISAISRLRDLGIGNDLLAESLAAIISQRLVRTICPNCGKDYELPMDSELRELFNLGDKKYTLHKGDGCELCRGTGYKGRTLVQESIFMDKNTRRLIQSGKSTLEIEDYVVSKGFVSIAEDALEKALNGVTTLDEIRPIWEDLI